MRTLTISLCLGVVLLCSGGMLAGESGDVRMEEDPFGPTTTNRRPVAFDEAALLPDNGYLRTLTNELMTTDRIELFLLDPAVDVGTQATFRALYLEHAYPIVASAVVSTSAVQRVVGRWVEFLSERTASGGAADCFPTYGIRFFSSGRVICEGVIGWETWNYDLSIRGKEIYRGMDWRSPVPKAFKACVEAFLPIPAELRGTNFLFRLIAHTERAFNKAREATR